ncbi:MAG: MFS transporter [Pseudomonadota bacterium]
MTSQQTSTAARFPGSKAEFIALIAGIMSMAALAIDIMLPALDAIGADFVLKDQKQQQFVILSFFLGLGVAQIFVGPLADRIGRRKILIVSLGLYSLCAFAAVFAPSFELVILSRALQGAASAGGRILVNAIIRDLYEGRTMARILSIAQIAFITIPIIAPLLGSGLLLIGPWRGIFLFIGVFGLFYMAWVTLRLPETQQPTGLGGWSSLKIAAKDRTLIVCSVAAGLIGTGLVVYLSNVAQIISDVYGRPGLLAFCFAITASIMGLCAFTSSKLVGRFGMRRLASVAILIFTATSGTMTLFALSALPPLWLFLLAQSVILSCYIVVQANLTALGLEKLGHVAGSASSLFGTISTLLAVLVAGFIGQNVEGGLGIFYGGVFFAGSGALLVVFAARLSSPASSR